MRSQQAAITQERYQGLAARYQKLRISHQECHWRARNARQQHIQLLWQGVLYRKSLTPAAWNALRAQLFAAFTAR